MHWVKKHKGVLAVCDENVLGKKLGSAFISEAFYKGSLVDDKRLSELLKNNRNINIVGARSVSAAKKAGIVCVTKKLKGVPYAIIFEM